MVGVQDPGACIAHLLFVKENKGERGLPIHQFSSAVRETWNPPVGCFWSPASSAETGRVCSDVEKVVAGGRHQSGKDALLH